MTIAEKMKSVEKRMYKEISKGNFEKAAKLREQYVNLSVESLARKLK